MHMYQQNICDMSNYAYNKYLVSGQEMRVALWGRKATEFMVSQDLIDAEKPILVLFTGCLIKNFYGKSPVLFQCYVLCPENFYIGIKFHLHTCYIF